MTLPIIDDPRPTRGVPHRSRRRHRLAATAVAAFLGLLAAFLVAPGSAHAAVGTQCSKHWHTIAFGQTGLNVEPDEYGSMHAVGNPRVDPWNQYVQFCRDDRWGVGQYAIRSNRGGAYWTSEWYSNIPVFSHSTIDNPDELFYLQKYDSKFSTIYWVSQGWEHSGFLYADSGRGYGVYANGGDTLSGINLFVISPADPMA